MNWIKFDINDTSTYPKNGDYLIWVLGNPIVATFHEKKKYGSHWWEYDDIDDICDDDVEYYTEIYEPKRK